MQKKMINNFEVLLHKLRIKEFTVLESLICIIEFNKNKGWENVRRA